MRAGTERKVVYIGSRKSELAMIQTNHVKTMLEKTPWRQVHFHYQNNVHSRDEVLDVRCRGSENPGLFTKELEHGLIRGSYDLAVHSLKDKADNTTSNASVVWHPKERGPDRLFGTS